MSFIIPFESVTKADRSRVGGKGYALSVMARTGAKVPSGGCVTIDAYRNYVRRSGLAERIRLELSRKRFADMRWRDMGCRTQDQEYVSDYASPAAALSSDQRTLAAALW